MSSTTAANEPMSKAYDPKSSEPKAWERWTSAGAFNADPQRVVDGEARPYSILIPPPNVTAALHLGHALNNTIQDILTRAHRMMGYETLWMPGTDHAGIATQTMVDKKLKAEGKGGIAEYKKKELNGENGREEFVKLVQEFKDEFEARITHQLQTMGCSCDWRRQRFTMDDICARAVREAFFRLFRDGLIYRGKRLVNWDPVTQTALADDEVEMEEVEGAFYYLRYPMVKTVDGDQTIPVTWSELGARGYPDAHQHPEDEQAWVTVATTRPETYLGDTAVAMNPKDPRAKSVNGFNVMLPLVGRIIPIIEDDYVVLPVKFGGEEGDAKAEMSTGFLKVTPAHDPNDYMIGQRHNLAQINVMAPDASISDQHGWEDVGDAQVFLGKSREDARKLVVKEFQARTVSEGAEGSLLEAIKPHVHSVGHSYRSHVPVEPYLSDQWYCKVSDDTLRGSAQRALKPEQRTEPSLKGWPDSRPKTQAPDSTDGSMTFYPARYAKTYETWHDNLRDWCISRQLWWGHRIPVWRKQVRLTESNWYDEIVSTGLDHFIDGSDPSATIRVVRLCDGEQIDPSQELMPVTPETEDEYEIFVCSTESMTALESKHGYSQDPDVLDTWFSSALWPLSTMGWPDTNAANAGNEPIDDFDALLKAYNPTSVLTTAREIITLWVSRMTMFNRYFLAQDQVHDKPPFKDVFIHAMIQDGEGRKMSKSLGNGVDPLDIIETHGADAMRFTLCQMTTQTQDVRMPVEPDPETGKNTSPKFDIGRNLCNKLWNASRFAMSMLEKNPVRPGPPIDPQQLSLVDRWMLSRVAHAQGAIGSALRSYQFKDYADALYDLLWRDFCDWYLESIKPTLSEDEHQPAVLRSVLDSILRLMHPVTPFITESVFERLDSIPSREILGVAVMETKSTETLCQSGWPNLDPSLRDEVAEEGYDRCRALVSAIREVRASNQVPPKRSIVLHAPGTLGSDVKRWNPLVETLANVREVSDSAPEGASVAFVFEGSEYKLSDLADALDSGAQRERLEKELADLDKSISALEGRLNNPGYTQKAPAHLVDQTRAELTQKQADRDSVRASLDALG